MWSNAKQNKKYYVLEIIKYIYYCRSNQNSYDFLYLLLTFLLYPFFNNQQNM